MKKIIFFFVCALSTVASIAQNTVVSDKNAEVRKAIGFHGVHIASGIDLYISQGNSEAVAVSANETRYRNNIKVEVENGILKIYYDAGMGVHFSFGNARNMKAYVTIKDISELTASGGSDVYVEGSLQSSNLNLRLSGGSDFRGKVEAGIMGIKASGGSDVKISGKAANVSVDMNGGSDFRGYDFVSDVCNIEASGGSDVYITVNKEMSVHASGGSDVSYRGNAVIKNYNTSGSSEIHKNG